MAEPLREATGYRKGSKSTTRLQWPSGEHVLITGGTSGIGFALAQQCAAQNACVTALGTNTEKLEHARHQLQCISSNSVCLQCDVASANKVHDAVRCANELHGLQVNALICSAGVSNPGFVSEQPAEQFNATLQTNVAGCANAVRSCLLLGKLKRIVLISSMAGQVGLTAFSAYSASKFALRGFAESLAMELKPLNIKVTLAFPPDTDTPLLKQENMLKPTELQEISHSGGLAQPERVAKAVIAAARIGVFQAPIGFDGWMLARLTAGFAPPNSTLALALEVMLMGLLRLVAVFYLFTWDSIVQKHRSRCTG